MEKKTEPNQNVCGVRLDRLAEGVFRRPTQQHWTGLRSEIGQTYGVRLDKPTELTANNFEVK